MNFFNRIAALVLSFFMVLSADLSRVFNPVQATPLEGREYSDGELSVIPDESKHIKVTVPDRGKDIYSPCEGEGGYRYGPTLFVNADGSLDAWFATAGNSDAWDIFNYRHSPDGGETWTQEKTVLSPTPGSYDHFSVCDPGVVRFGGWYYIGYTSTIYKDGICNNVFVARSKNPDGPFEKWDGSGWGGNPEPIVWFDEDWSAWGAGEPSMIVVGDELYIYYTWKSYDKNGVAVNQTRLSVADATDENWPATMSFRGPAIVYADGMCDSADVKYVEDFGKFIAVSTSSRFTDDACVSVYESDDGLTFEKACDLNTNIAYRCHNSGISSRPNGHIRLSDRQFIAYAHGSDWGKWPTRMHEVSLSLVDEKFVDTGVNVKDNELIPTKYIIPELVGIRSISAEYERHLSDGAFRVQILKVSTASNEAGTACGVKFSGYDSDIVSFIGGLCVPKGVGETFVTASWRGFSFTFLVCIRADDVPIDSENPKVVSFEPMFTSYTLSLSANEHKQLRALARFDDNSFHELCEPSQGVAYSVRNPSVISVDGRGVVRAVAVGETQVVMTCGEFRAEISVIVK